MTTNHFYRLIARTSLLAVTCSLSFTGCKKPPIDDQTIAGNVQNALTSDAAISNEPVRFGVVDGVVTLTGNVSNDTARMVAAQDTARVDGVKEVVNALTIQGLALTPTITTPASPTEARPVTPQERQLIANNQTLPPPSPSAPPIPPPAPVFHDISVPAGTTISVRINQTLDSGSSQDDTPFTGIVNRTVVVDGETVIPAGSGVTGRVISVHEAGHYKGNSLLSVELTGIRRRGEDIPISTDPYTLEGKGRGKNTAEKIGGGAAVGAILGGIFGGGKGAAIGAAAGGGGGAVLNGVTRGEQVQIPSESVIRFRISNRFPIRSLGRTNDPDADEPPPPTLQQHQP